MGSADVDDLAGEVERLLPARRGHFRFESGHHGARWLDLELLFLRPARLRPLAAALAGRLTALEIEAVCGPLVEGAFLATQVAEALEVSFTYTERRVSGRAGGLFPVDYPVPAALRAQLAGRRVAVVNDVINAGSAVRGTLAALHGCGARPVALAALAVLGDGAAALATAQGIPLVALAALPGELWMPERCPLCAEQVPLEPTPT